MFEGFCTKNPDMYKTEVYKNTLEEMNISFCMPKDDKELKKVL